MKGHSVKLMTAVLAVLGAAGCFDDPTSSLRNGPSRLALNRSAVALTNGDSILIEAGVRDEQGNVLPITGASWTSDDAAVATVAVANLQVPGDGSARAYIKATNGTGAVTYVRITARGLSDSIRVTSLPGVIPAGLASVTGTPRADTIPGVTNFTAGDTLTVTLPTTMTFDPTASLVRFGTNNGYILDRTTTSLKVMARGPFDGNPVVTRITFAGNATTGPILLDSLATGDHVTISRARLIGTTSVTGDTLTVTASGGTAFDAAASTLFLGSSPTTILSRTASQITAVAPLLPAASYTGGVSVRTYTVTGTTVVDSVYSSSGFTIARAAFYGNVAVSNNILMTIDAPAGTSFNISGAANTLSGVKFGGTTASVISRTASQLRVSTSADYTGPVTVTNVLVGAVRLDSLKTTTDYTISRATLPGTVTATGSNMLDTITVTAGAGVTFQTGTTPSQVVSSGINALVISRTAGQLVVVPSAPGAISVTNVDVSGTVFPSLGTASNFTVGTTTGETFEPANNAPGGRTINISGATVANPLVIFGAADGGVPGTGVGTDADDFYTFTLAAPGTVNLQLQFSGTGAGGSNNPDFDLLACDAPCANFVGGFGGATAGQPENLTLSNLAAGTYHIWVNAWDTHNTTTGAAATRSYRLLVWQ